MKLSTLCNSAAITLASFVQLIAQESRFDAISRSLGDSYSSHSQFNPMFFYVIGAIVVILIIASIIQKQIHMRHLKKQHEEQIRHQKELISHHKDFLDHVRRK